jgi:hypothetical protein
MATTDDLELVALRVEEIDRDRVAVIQHRSSCAPYSVSTVK